MEELSHQQKRMISRGSRVKQGTSSCRRDGGSPGASMLSTPPSAPHELCLSSASADRYEGHGTREYALAAEHARRRSPFQKGYEEGTPRHCVPCSDGQSLKLRPKLPSSTVPRASSFTSVQCPGVQQSGLTMYV